eukprot:PITA_33640
MTLETSQLLQLKNVIRETPTILELADHSTVKPEGVIEDLIISVESWNYPADFVVLQTKTKLRGHPLILGRPWLTTTDAFISCRSSSMTISNGCETKQLTLYPHATPMINNDDFVWLDYDDNATQPILTLGQALTLKYTTGDEVISNFLSEPSLVTSETYNSLTAILESETQVLHSNLSPSLLPLLLHIGGLIPSPVSVHEDGGDCDLPEQRNGSEDSSTSSSVGIQTPFGLVGIASVRRGDLPPQHQEKLKSKNLPQTSTAISPKSITVEIKPSKTLNINLNLTDVETQQLTKLLCENKEAFSWDYTNMKGISPELCTHRIYIKEGCQPICQPQRRMNPNLREIVKEELQKLLNAEFIYPIFDSKWVSPLVIIPNKNGKWRVCVDYRALNKATQKDHFPLPFNDQVLDSLSGKRFFSFLDGFNGYNHIKIAPQYQDRTTFTSPWGTFCYRVLPFGLCNALATFQRAVIGIFSDMLNDSMEIFMDDFTPYGVTFENALQNVEKVLKRCVQSHLSLRTKKCHMMMNEGIVLGNFISFQGIQVDPSKV